MKNTYLISIIIPFYNEEKFISECINSIQDQSFTNFECLFVNDGSCDKSTEIVKKYSKIDSRIKLLQKDHSGLIESINLGFKYSTGSIVCRMDADDIMPTQRLELQQKELFKRGRASLITGKVNYFSESNISTGYKEYENWLNSLNTPDDYLKNCLIECPVASPSWMMFKEDVERLNYFEKGIYPEDYNFILKAIMNRIDIYSIDNLVLNWRDYPNRTSKILNEYSRDNFWNIRARHMNFFLKSFTKYQNTSVFGVGESGKTLCKALKNNNCPPLSFVDIHPDRVGKVILKTQVLHLNDFNEYKNNYILIALRDKKVKEKIKLFLKQHAKEELKDYIFCC